MPAKGLVCKNPQKAAEGIVKSVFGFALPRDLSHRIVMDHVNLPALTAALEQALERHAHNSARKLIVGRSTGPTPGPKQYFQTLFKDILDFIPDVQVVSWEQKGDIQSQDFERHFGDDDPEDFVDLDGRMWQFSCHITASISPEETWYLKVDAEVTHKWNIDNKSKTISATDFESSVTIDENFVTEFGPDLMQNFYRAFFEWTLMHPGVNYVLAKVEEMSEKE